MISMGLTLPQPNSIPQKRLTSVKFKRNLMMTNLYWFVARANTRAPGTSESDPVVQVEATGTTWRKITVLIMEWGNFEIEVLSQFITLIKEERLIGMKPLGMEKKMKSYILLFLYIFAIINDVIFITFGDIVCY